MTTSGITLGNPSPMGLFCFGLATAMLMMVDMGWIEEEYEAVIANYGIWLGGVGQVLTGIFELLKGNSFSFAVFCLFGFHWIQWGMTWNNRHNTDYVIAAYVYNDGTFATYCMFGVLSMCFWVIALRKTSVLLFIFTVLVPTWFMLGIGYKTQNASVKKAAGYIGFITALGALYGGVAELINEEYGSDVCPGLRPLTSPERFVVSKDNLRDRFTYDASSNTLNINLMDIQIKSMDDVLAIKEAVEDAVMSAKTPDNKVHAVVHYRGVLVADEVFDAYWKQAAELERQYFLSSQRFHVQAFGSTLATNALPASHRRQAALAANISKV